MKNVLNYLICFCFFGMNYAQVGIGTTNPEGALDIVTTNDTGVVIPRVSSTDNVSDGLGNPPVNGTLVYDISKNAFCFYLNSKWTCMEIGSDGNPFLSNTAINEYQVPEQSYFKASNTTFNQYFGFSISMSGDGSTIAVGAPAEGGTDTVINGNQTTTTSTHRGAVYVFHFNGTSWQQEAYIKPSTLYLSFGLSVDLDFTGDTLAVGRDNETFVFRRNTGVWTEQEQIVYPQAPFWGMFGGTVSLSSDGNTLAVSAVSNTSTATGIGGDPSHSTGFVRYYGAVYLFNFNGSNWIEEEFFKQNVFSEDSFGFKVALSGDATVLAVSTPYEDSNATGINGDENNNLAVSSGAVYIYKKIAGTWQFDAFLKASNAEAGDQFGRALAISGDGSTIAVGAPFESCGFPGINASSGANNFINDSGAIYIFNDVSGAWLQDAYIKNNILDANDRLGYSSIALNEDGTLVVAGAGFEDSLALGVNENASTNNGLTNSGAVFVFQKIQDNWIQTKMLKATNARSSNYLSRAQNNLQFVVNGSLINIQQISSNIAISATGNKIIIGSLYEDSDATGIQGDQENINATSAGAVYLFQN